jgi:thiol-disulfide isomerase/thioredoxin
MPVGRGAAGEGCGVDRAPRRFMPSPAVHLVMPRMAHLRLAPVLLAVGLIGAGGFAWYQARAAAPPPVARPGSPAPPITLPLLDGGDADLARQRGNVVLLNFWATWCVPCRTEMPALQRLADGLWGERFVLFTVDLQEDAAAIEPFRRELGLGLPVLLDRDGEVTRSYGVRALPATFLIDQRGVLRQQRLGPLVEGGADTPWSGAWITEQVRALLGQQA